MNNSKRLVSIDRLRGFIMVLMAIDHANEFIAHQHSSGEFWGGSLPYYKSALPFLTRFVTHLSAPGFFFLMGVSMLLFTRSRRDQGWSEWQIMRHFLTRGLLLIGLQIAVENYAWSLSLSPSSGRPPGIPASPDITYYGVLYALGGTMILGSLLLRLKPIWLTGIGAALILATEFLTPAPAMVSESFSPLWQLLMVPGFSENILVYYPVLPWLGLVLFGMMFAHLLKVDAQKALAQAWKVGGMLLIAFLLLRLGNGFGNLQLPPGDSWIDFLNVVKYPPSITFLLFTMGVNLMFLSAFARVNRFEKYLYPLEIFGRGPLFFYVAHLYLYAGIGIWIGAAGTSQPVMYLYWLLGLAILFPISLWFGNLKQKSPPDSILHFF